jgi:hypothetical protein
VSNYTVETIDLTETSRLRVEVDDSPENPRKDWDMATGFVKIEGRGDSRVIDVEPVHDSPIPIVDAHERLATYRTQPRFSANEDLVERWARIFHGMHIEYDSEHGGYWFVSPTFQEENQPFELKDHDTLAWQAEVIKGDRETYRQWADAEVYGVILERLETWAKIPKKGLQLIAETREEWEEVDSLWGCYLDDDYTAQVVAEGHFGLTEEERAALGLPEQDAPTGGETPREAATGVSGEW